MPTSITPDLTPEHVIIAIPESRVPALSIQETLNALAYRHINSARTHRLQGIDAQTSRSISTGTFTYDSKLFSLSIAAQFNTLVMYTRRNDVNFTYPVIRSTNDSLSSVTLADADAVEAFYVASEAEVRALLDEGNTLKATVSALSTLQEIIDFVDPRI